MYHEHNLIVDGAREAMALFARKIREKPKPLYKEDDISIDGHM
jgi:hypothetical protein